jgi:DNA polymerase-1
MKAIKTHELSATDLLLNGDTETLWIYNGLDCCVTAEVFGALLPQLDNTTRATYEFSKALQAPVLEMKLRGILVDQERRDEVIREYRRQSAQFAENLGLIVGEGIGYPDFKWSSPLQLKKLLHEVLKIPRVPRKPLSVDRDTLEQLSIYFWGRPVISHVLRLRDLNKKIAVLETVIDRDGRMRTSYNIAGTTTGRFSSSLSDFGTGTNLQNIEELLRSVFVADRGMKLAYIDLEQAESRLVGAIEWNLFNDSRYLDACESGDLHTTVCRLAWTNLPWTGDLARDRKIAEAPFYRQHSYRHMAKVLGHGTNYNGKPDTMSKNTHLDPGSIAAFQANYFAAFPAHQRWHARVATDLLSGSITTLTGRRRWFFGRRTDDATIREAINYDPQGSVGDILNRGMLQVWRANICQLLLQIHDAILVQYPEEHEERVLPLLFKALEVPVPLNNGRTLIIPSEAKTGWNWSVESDINPDGLRKYHRGDTRTRQRAAPTKLDRILRSL